MDKVAVDYSSLEEKLTTKKVYKLNEVQHRLKKVAFDVVRFFDSDNIDGLWQIQRCDDGEYIVAMYEEEPSIKTSADWSVISDKSGNNINIFYKNEPVKKVSLASLGMTTEDSSVVCSFLPKKLASDKNLVSSLLNDLSSQEKNNLLERYPELNK